MDRHYRTQVEVLRDLVDAAKREHCKTRIIGLANLNEASFARYAALASAMGLLRHDGRSYRSTIAAEEWLGAANGVFTKRLELDRALLSLDLISRRTDSHVAGLRLRLAGTRSHGDDGDGRWTGSPEERSARRSGLRSPRTKAQPPRGRVPLA